MLESYIPLLVFGALGLAVGGVFAVINGVLGPSRPNQAKSDPYECGLPSEFSRTFRFGVPFYMTAMLFLVFDLEVVFLYAVAPVLTATESVFVLVAILIFVFFLVVGFVYEWAKGGLEWR